MFNPKDRGRKLRGRTCERSKKGKKRSTDRKIKYNDPEMLRIQEIYADTKAYTDRLRRTLYMGTRFHESTTKLNFESVQEMFDSDEEIQSKQLYPIQVKVINQDTLTLASIVHEKLYKSKPKIVSEDEEVDEDEDQDEDQDEEDNKEEQKIMVLNCACADRPGGGVEKGRKGQEEMLYLKTTLNLFFNPKTIKSFYPMKDDEMLISERVGIVKREDYVKISEDRIKMFDFLAIAAIRRPGKEIDPDTEEERFTEEYQREITRKKIESIFQMGVLGNYEVLVLGSIGCNAYKNPVHEMRDIFIEMIEKYGKYFKGIFFAIKSYNQSRSYDVFKKIEERFGPRNSEEPEEPENPENTE